MDTPGQNNLIAFVVVVVGGVAGGEHEVEDGDVLHASGPRLDQAPAWVGCTGSLEYFDVETEKIMNIMRTRASQKDLRLISLRHFNLYNEKGRFDDKLVSFILHKLT